MNTELGKKLQKIKDDYIAKLDEVGFEKELRERKGTDMTYREWIESYFVQGDTWDNVEHCSLADKLLDTVHVLNVVYIVYTKQRIYMNYDNAHICVERMPSNVVYIRTEE